ncbi:CRISPR-associated protein [Brasilonema octagenarum UFV-E1]|uniref:CRISPR-associated protein n=2 Tax=Brasilonema TaxID=383614 RepID=A0A856MGR5_9CYAN|nr:MULTISPECIES: putative CRISPR-associated protein [Brasilonema]NMF66456.1 CRISPR-associated protein [Brasilonema octagenarum UFV-OR1]QDL09812.1 CRISPR-associated protein [Brasilonema sennae CENA114]QDL16166.1 CRISPR-associated protein [Brasilonema octagenarum UFV-E1]
MPRLVISTVGTSLLTNQIDREFEKNYYDTLRDTVNCTREEIDRYDEDVKDIIDTLKKRAEEELNGDLDDIREASAELNGIYGLYDKEIEKGKEDTHLLITTDTAQGRVAAEILENFLKQKGLNSTSTYFPVGFSLSSSDTFSEGIASLFSYLQEIIVSSKHSQHQICFNLVGSFKAIQGYFNTIGMFYADEIIYVFEGSNEVIKIPKLPVQVDKSIIEPYKVQLAMMNVGDILKSSSEAQKVPNEWVLVDGQEMTLSTWGKLLWSQCKDYFLSQENLLNFPYIEYAQSFIEDYKNDKNKRAEEKIKLQETLARCSCLLTKKIDGVSALRQDGIIRLRRYEGKHKQIDHFDLPKDRRVSCIAKNNTLYLRHYGEHDYVNNNP